MNEEPKVSKQITRKLETYLNRERVERRFDTSGLGVYRTHPLVVKLDLAYLIANEDQKKKKAERPHDKEESGEDHGRRRRRRDDQTDKPTTPRVRSLPQRKTQVQRSEVDRLAKNAHSTLKNIDADKVATVYRFRQQMIPCKVRHQGKVKQVSTSVHAMLNAEEAWRYRRENDEREKVKKYREQQKAKAKQEAAKKAREQELSKLPVGVRMEIMRQNEKQAKLPLLEKLLEPLPARTDTHHSQHQYTVPMATKAEFADGEASAYEDDFEEEEDAGDESETLKDVQGEQRDQDCDESLSDSRGWVKGESQSLQTDEDSEVRGEIADDDNAEIHHHGNDDTEVIDTRRPRVREGDSSSVSQSTAEGKNDEACIAAVTTANDAGSTVSFATSSYTYASGTIPSPQTRRSRAGDGQSFDDAYENDSFESDGEDAEEQGVFMTDGNVNDKVKGQDDVTDEVTNQLARTDVKDERSSAAGSPPSARSLSASTTKSITSRKKDEEKTKTQEYVRTESVVSLKEIC